jgi:hypothetical protein
LGEVSADKIPQIIEVDYETCPVITLQPKDIIAGLGQDVSFTIRATAKANYLWQMNNDGTWKDVAGINFEDKASAVFKINDIPLSLNNTKFRCIVSNDCFVTSSVVTLTVVVTGSIYGTLTYNNFSKSPLSNTKMFLYTSENIKKDSTITDLKGYYNFDSLYPGEYRVNPEIKYKWDGVNPTDALMTNKFYLYNYIFKNELIRKSADVNGDLFVKPDDALLINKRYTGFIDSFKVDDWLYNSDVITMKGENVLFNIRAICAGDVNASF